MLYSNQERRRNNRFKLNKRRFNKEIRKNWFTNRAVNDRTRLSYHVVTAESKGKGERLDRFMEGNVRSTYSL